METVSFTVDYTHRVTSLIQGSFQVTARMEEECKVVTWGEGGSKVHYKRTTDKSELQQVVLVGLEWECLTI